VSENQSNPGRGRSLGLIAAVLAFGIVMASPSPEGLNPVGMRVLAATLAMAILWVTEALPIPVTSLLPILMFPLLGIMPSDQVAGVYTNDLIFLFFGGFFLALALEQWGAHRRVALIVMSWFGTKPAAIIAGVMTSVAFLSMWISNTATSLMMLPICIALIEQLEERGVPKPQVQRFSIALLLGLAYAANVGGMGTPIGTGPNGIFMRQFAELGQPSFAQWMSYAIPLVIVFIAAVWFIFTRFLFRFDPAISFGERDFVRQKLRDLGPLGREERGTLIIFALTVFLWITRRDLGPIPGWASLLNAAGFDWISARASSGVGDSAVSILAVLLLCVTRVGPKRQPLADWNTATQVPWGMLLLLGGGFAIAGAFGVESGEGLSLSAWLGERLGGIAGESPLVVLPSIALGVSFLTEFTSNTATTSVIVPILAHVGDAEVGRLLALTATFSASCAFMFPVATPPNAIVFASGRVGIRTMMKAGIWLNLLGGLLIPLAVWFLARHLLP
jgi:solute carrier family 13 (sodium-dependent dicarboxylate transporter), member 2/3/5